MVADDYRELYGGYRGDIDDDWADAGRELDEDFEVKR